MHISRTLIAAGVLSSLMAIPVVGLTMSHKESIPPKGDALYEHITQTSPYEQWPMWPGKDKLYKGTEPHGVLLTTYVNEAALEGIKEYDGQMEDGAIIVKENYKPDKTLAAVTVMYKKKDYDTEAGDFFWLKYAPGGKILAEGKVQSCIGCHQGAKGGDFLFTNDPE